MQDRWSNCLQTLEGHSRYVRLVAFSYDSTQLASTSDDGLVKVWDARSGDCLSTINVGNILYRILFESNNKYLHTDVSVVNFNA
jgi:WD40 repeat protein